MSPRGPATLTLGGLAIDLSALTPWSEPVCEDVALVRLEAPLELSAGPLIRSHEADSFLVQVHGLWYGHAAWVTRVNRAVPLVLDTPEARVEADRVRVDWTERKGPPVYIGPPYGFLRARLLDVRCHILGSFALQVTPTGQPAT